jgi:hypothetical protein
VTYWEKKFHFKNSNRVVYKNIYFFYSLKILFYCVLFVSVNFILPICYKAVIEFKFICPIKGLEFVRISIGCLPKAVVAIPNDQMKTENAKRKRFTEKAFEPKGQINVSGFDMVYNYKSQ